MTTMASVGKEYPVVLGSSFREQARSKDAHAEWAWNCIAIFEQNYWRLEMMSTELVTSPSRAAFDLAQMIQTSQFQDQLHHQSSESMPDLDDSAGLLDNMDLERELQELDAEGKQLAGIQEDSEAHPDPTAGQKQVQRAAKPGAAVSNTAEIEGQVIEAHGQNNIPDEDGGAEDSADEDKHMERPEFIPEDEWNAMPAHFREFCT